MQGEKGYEIVSLGFLSWLRETFDERKMLWVRDPFLPLRNNVVPSCFEDMNRVRVRSVREQSIIPSLL
ncbi:hypothetical protein Pan241w_27760 [Gimesia alba]|uniref:Uncharacterized protein n=1 Tax=Gimesia alba TaxID=2527973 RepID=A0A517RFN2_9PLAN|nr:hypothetical protein Pan241w_27760 [Gimesia alba]